MGRGLCSTTLPSVPGKDQALFSHCAPRDAPAPTPAIATGLHTVWIEEYNHDRIHRRVTDAAGHGADPSVSLALEAQRGAPLATNKQHGRRLSCATATHRSTYKTSQCSSLHQLSQA